jgi:ubiquinone/menaquinone biosynthesis C-methylase UbiE
LDVGTNDGCFVNLVAQQYPGSQFIGIDINEGAINKISPSGSNATFLVRDALNLPAEWKEKFGYITIIDAFQHLPNSFRGTSEFFRVLKPGGWLSVIEIKRGDTYVEDVDLPNAVIHYLFEMQWCGEGCDGDNSERPEASKSSIPNALINLKAPLIKAGFQKIDARPLPRVDLDHTIHIFCQK